MCSGLSLIVPWIDDDDDDEKYCMCLPCWFFPSGDCSVTRYNTRHSWSKDRLSNGTCTCTCVWCVACTGWSSGMVSIPNRCHVPSHLITSLNHYTRTTCTIQYNIMIRSFHKLDGFNSEEMEYFNNFLESSVSSSSSVQLVGTMKSSSTTCVYAGNTTKNDRTNRTSSCNIIYRFHFFFV